MLMSRKEKSKVIAEDWTIPHSLYFNFLLVQITEPLKKGKQVDIIETLDNFHPIIL